MQLKGMRFHYSEKNTACFSEKMSTIAEVFLVNGQSMLLNRQMSINIYKVVLSQDVI